MVAIKTTPGEPEERSLLTPGPHKMAICTWKDGTQWETDVPTLTLKSRNNATKVAPNTKRKKKKKVAKTVMKVMKKPKAMKAMKKPAAAAEKTESSDGDEEEEGEEEDGSGDEDEDESEDEEQEGASEEGAVENSKGPEEPAAKAQKKQASRGDDPNMRGKKPSCPNPYMRGQPLMPQPYMRGQPLTQKCIHEGATPHAEMCSSWGGAHACSLAPPSPSPNHPMRHTSRRLTGPSSTKDHHHYQAPLGFSRGRKVQRR
jgi:hypothetical protein